MLGHSHVSVTLGFYSHVLPPMQREAAKAMSDTDARSIVVVCAPLARTDAATPTLGPALHDHDHLQLQHAVRRAA